MTDIRRTCGRARVVSQLREPTQTSIQPANLRTHASRQRYARKNDAHRQEPLRGRCGGLHHATRSVFPMRALVGGERRRGAHDLYIKKHLLVEGATGAGSSSAQPARKDRTRLLLLRRCGFVLRLVGPAAFCGSEEAEATPTALRVRPLS